jgi:hypothetical protein
VALGTIRPGAVSDLGDPGSASWRAELCRRAAHRERFFIGATSDKYRALHADTGAEVWHVRPVHRQRHADELAAPRRAAVRRDCVAIR